MNYKKGSPIATFSHFMHYFKYKILQIPVLIIFILCVFPNIAAQTDSLSIRKDSEKIKSYPLFEENELLEFTIETELKEVKLDIGSKIY